MAGDAIELSQYTIAWSFPLRNSMNAAITLPKPGLALSSAETAVQAAGQSEALSILIYAFYSLVVANASKATGDRSRCGEICAAEGPVNGLPGVVGILFLFILFSTKTISSYNSLRHRSIGGNSLLQGVLSLNLPETPPIRPYHQ